MATRCTPPHPRGNRSFADYVANFIELGFSRRFVDLSTSARRGVGKKALGSEYQRNSRRRAIAGRDWNRRCTSPARKEADRRDVFCRGGSKSNSLGGLA